jgi:uncharacterized protein (DUF433 family)
MQLEDYFDFEKTDEYERIRIKGTRINIEHILDPYVKEVETPESIFHGYRHSLKLEQVYATITYYLHNQKEVDGYLQRTHDADDKAYQEYLKQEPSDVVKRLRAIKAERKLRDAATTQET